ncbi:NAD(+)/NADH kinase [Coprothermobacteraceae bacterium]|nr:NAD(+)/NADH kinase [Coprothermobacteraceae bacterium]
MHSKTYFLECHLWREQALRAAKLFRELAAEQGWSESSLKDADLLVGIGGDGTFLRTARLAAVYGKPFWTLGAGRVNFLPNVVEDLPSAIKEVLKGDVRVERIPAYGYVLDKPEGTMDTFFLNDLLITKSGHTATITLTVLVDEIEVFRVFGDGVVIATPLGSTGYNISAGGPVIDRRLPAFAITPLNAHQTNLRSVIVPADAQIEIRIDEAFRGALIVADGVEVLPLPIDRSVIIRRDVLHVEHLVNSRAVGFYDKMDSKFNWRSL